MTVRLLVSVRSADEAVVAATGGADIIDIKEPRHGSLGRPSA
ncbi:MAG: (5-formylfuran-3-yl)methyl phosphate synthase, partial [Planctomycetaceae bacterium]